MSISIESAFNELGTDAVTGVEMMDWLGISTVDLGDPVRFSRLQGVIDYFKGMPADTKRFLITRATKGKMVDKLNHIWEYINLLGRRRAQEENIKSLEKEESALGEAPDPLIYASVHSQIGVIKENLGIINAEIAIYEK